MSITANIAAREAHTAALHGDRPFAEGTVALTAAQAAEALFGIAYKQPGMITLADCQEVLTRVHDERGSTAVDAVLSRHGVWKLPDLFIGMYERFFLYCQAILTYGASPFYGWDLDSIKDKVRDRWLLWHAESDCLWEVRGKLTDELSDGLVSDVTGIVEHEHRFLKNNRRFGDPLPPKEEEL